MSDYKRAKAEAMAAKAALSAALKNNGFHMLSADIDRTVEPAALHRLARGVTGYYNDMPSTGKVIAAAERLNLAIGEWFKAADEIAEKATRDTST